jgi:hypothetical protein
MKSYVPHVAALLLLAGSAAAIPFDTGAVGGVVKVGPTVSVGDGYTSLAVAATAFNGLAGGINANWTIEIVEDLTEPAHVYIANATNGFKLTIKPEATKNPTITFTQTTGGTTAGALVFGVNTSGAVAAANVFTSVNGYEIDGSNNGTNSRNLTITNASNIGTTIILRVVADTDGLVVKNTRLISTKASGTDTIIGLGAGKVDSIDRIPDNLRVENCELRADLLTNTSATSGIGVAGTNAFTTAIDATANMTGHIFVGNDVFVRHRGIAPVYSRNYQVLDNIITLNNPNSGTESTAIGDLLSNGSSTPGTVTILRNRIVQATTANTAATFGISGITIGVGSGTTYVVSNNTITGMAASSASAVDSVYRGIRLASGADIFNIEHNSINVDASGTPNGTTVGRVGAISITTLTTGSVNLSNNLIRYAQPAGAAIVGASATGLAPTSFKGNNIVATAAPVGVITGATGTPFVTHAAWLAEGYDTAGGQSVDPTTTTPAWNASLLFSGAPAGMAGVGASTVLTDIVGTARPATGALPGAQQPGASAGEWLHY